MASAQAGRQTDGQTDATDRQTRPSPKTTPRKHRHRTGKRAPGAKSQNPTYLDTKMADKKRACVLPVLVWWKQIPPPPITRGRAETLSPPLPILGRVGGQKAARAPRSTQKGTGHYVQKECVAANTKTETKRQESESRRPEKPRRPGRRGITQGREKRKRHQKTERKQWHPDP